MTTYNKPLGTPLSPAATRVMLLGSGELGKEVLIALQPSPSTATRTPPAIRWPTTRTPSR